MARISAEPSRSSWARSRISAKPVSCPTGLAPARHSLIPLYAAGLWLAVNIARAGRGPTRVVGPSVLARPISMTSTPGWRPRAKARDSSGDESRMSWPMTTARSARARRPPLRRRRHRGPRGIDVELFGHQATHVVGLDEVGQWGRLTRSEAVSDHGPGRSAGAQSRRGALRGVVEPGRTRRCPEPARASQRRRGPGLDGLGPVSASGPMGRSLADGIHDGKRVIGVGHDDAAIGGQTDDVPATRRRQTHRVVGAEVITVRLGVGGQGPTTTARSP